MNTYQVFYNPNSASDCVTLECDSLQQLEEVLREEEMLGEGEKISSMSWVVYENGKQIQ